MATEPANSNDDPQVSRRDLLVLLLRFQLKLLADGLRDVVLSPLSVVATLLGVLFRGDNPDHYFQRLMHLGRESDRYINLFEQHTAPQTPDTESSDSPGSREAKSQSNHSSNHS